MGAQRANAATWCCPVRGLACGCCEVSESKWFSGTAGRVFFSFELALVVFYKKKKKKKKRVVPPFLETTFFFLAHFAVFTHQASTGAIRIWAIWFVRTREGGEVALCAQKRFI
jgi:hypothetical protein